MRVIVIGGRGTIEQSVSLSRIFITRFISEVRRPHYLP